MANSAQIKLIKKGLRGWNAWRRENPNAAIDLSEAKLFEVDLSEATLSRGANLSGANLRGAKLSRAKLIRADLSGADLSKADFSLANLREANLSEANLDETLLSGVDLIGAKLVRANLSGALIIRADLHQADLSGARLSRANLREVDLREATLIGASLREAILIGALLRGAKLAEVDLIGATLFRADLSEAVLSGDMSAAEVGWTIFGDNDLSTVKGLDTIVHSGPSTIGVDTLFKSGGRIPEVFLRGAGVPDDFITFIPSLFGRAIEFYSCFISYSHQDEKFSQRLHSRMRSENLRVWYASEDMKGGRKLHEEIFSAIQIHDKVLLVLSENSMKSEWVMTEIRRARKVEREENRRKLFPIRLVDFDAVQKWECFDADSGKDLAVELREYYIPDFSNWKEHDAFEIEFSKLLRDLKTTET